jgi:hypothetical protein
MGRQGRYWLFFAILAVGLSLGWGQVGRKTHRLFETEPMVYLRAEKDCRPRTTPCAALAADRAVILGPATSGLLMRQIGMATSGILGGEAVSLATDGAELARAKLSPGVDEWLLADVPAQTAVLRLVVWDGHETTVAEFPLYPAVSSRP